MNSPLKFTFKTEFLPLLLVMATVAVAIWSYPNLPAQVITHWNLAGQANGWSSKTFHSVFFPILLIGMYLLFFVLPMIDPKNDRYADFAKTYFYFRDAILLVFFFIFLISTLVNLGYPISINHSVPLIIGLLMIFMGNYMGKIKKNWFMGIRTPWTLSSENVWNKTHRLGGWLFIIFGLVLMATPILPPKIYLVLFIISLSGVVVLPMVYSYFLYRQEKK